MHGRTVSWPARGDQATFRRRVLLLAGSGITVIFGSFIAAALWQPSLLTPLLPLAIAAALLVLLWTHGTARASARRAEVERSFAGLVVLHLGRAYQVDASPMLGEHPSRRQAARAALDRGRWALIVSAWDRYYVLAAAPALESGPRRTPVSFRSAAVADVVPALYDDTAIA